MKIYVASSWRNQEHPRIVEWLRELGHEVYDFKNPPSHTGFSWSQTVGGKPGKPSDLLRTLNDPIAQAGFESDMTALREADCCVLVMPAGISANLELGCAVGMGLETIVYIPEDAYHERDFEPELMWKMADAIVTNRDDLEKAVAAADSWLGVLYAETHA